METKKNRKAIQIAALVMMGMSLGESVFNQAQASGGDGPGGLKCGEGTCGTAIHYYGDAISIYGPYKTCMDRGSSCCLCA